MPWSILSTVSQRYYVISETHSEGFKVIHNSVISLRKSVFFLIVYILFYFSWVYTGFDMRICRIWRTINHLYVSVICYDSNWVGWHVWLSRVCSVGGAGTRSRAGILTALFILWINYLKSYPRVRTGFFIFGILMLKLRHLAPIPFWEIKFLLFLRLGTK